MLLVYGDESFDATQSRVCAVAGVVGTEEAWAELESKWKERTGPVPFHANHCDSDKGNYAPQVGEDANQKHKENKSLYRDLVTLMACSGVGGFASAYDLAAQREAFPAPTAPPLYYQPFVDVLEAMRNFAHNRESLVELTFDSRLESEHNAALIYANMRESNPFWSERLAEKISFVSSKAYPRIHVADLFAREAMKALDNEIGPVKREIRKSWKALRDTGRFAVASYSSQYFSDLKRDVPNLSGVLGFTPEDFHTWLLDRDRPWNFTAYLEFLHWHIARMTPEQRATFDSNVKPR
jgi:hypothetical protein